MSKLAFRYVGRKDDRSVVTGQRGYTSFQGQFDTNVYQEHFLSFPNAPVYELNESQTLILKQRKIKEYFNSKYIELKPIIGIPIRAGLLEMRKTVEDGFSLEDVEVVEHIITTATIPAALEPIRQELLDILNE